MGRAEVCGQQENFSLRAQAPQSGEQRLCVAAQVDNGAHAGLPSHFSGNVCKRWILGTAGIFEQPPFHMDPAHGLIQDGVVGEDLLRRPPGPGQGAEIRLGRGGKYHGTMVFPAQCVDGLNGGRRQIGGQALRFVKKDHTVGDVVQLAAIGGLVSKQALEKADGGCQDHRGVPAGSQLPCGIGQRLLTVVNQKVGKNVCIFLFALFSQRQKRQHNDDSTQPIFFAVMQCKMEHGQRFAHSGGGGQCEKPAWLLSGFAAGIVNFGPNPVQSGICLRGGPQPGTISVQCVQSGICIQRRTGAFFQVIGIVVQSGNTIVGIHQTGKEHPGVQHIFHVVLRAAFGKTGHFPGGKVRPKGLPGSQKFVMPPQGRNLSAGAAVCLRVVPCDAEGAGQAVQRNQPVVMPLNGFNERCEGGA